MSAPSIQDVSFYELVHKILTRQVELEQQEREEQERRIRDREPFQSVQSVAPIVDGRLPKPAAMREVICHDISTTGMAFYASQPPECEQLLVKLTTSSKATYLTAQIMHCRPVADGGEAAFLVGCKFTGRVDP